ncbi:hypothetical protein V8D89_000512 [Ganoderma adspersum]
MRSTSRRSRSSVKRSKASGSSKKANHRRPYKSFDPPPPTLSARTSLQRTEGKAHGEYNTHNPFDADIPLHDTTGQPLRLPNKLIACPSGGVIRAHVLYPTSEEFSMMHAVKPPNRFGRIRNLASPSSPAPAALSAHSTSTGSDVMSLVDQLKAQGLDPEDEIMLAYLKQIDMEGQNREYFHNAAEACERAAALHPVHVKMVRYRRAMRDGVLSVPDYEQLKLEVEQRRQEAERLRAEEEARRRAEEERLRAELEAKRREEERLRAEEEARREAQRREEHERRRQWELEEQRLYAERERARLEEMREMERVEELRRQWEVQQEQWHRGEKERLRLAAIERERENRSLTLRWTKMLQQQEQQARAEREMREYVESVRRAREHEDEKRRAEVEAAIARYQAEAVAAYESLWKKLKAKQCPPQCLSYDNFPLPIFDNARTTLPGDITRSAVEAFVLSPLRADARIRSRRARIKAELLLWHSDRFAQEVLPVVHEHDRELVEQAAANINRLLNEILHS